MVSYVVAISLLIVGVLFLRFRVDELFFGDKIFERGVKAAFEELDLDALEKEVGNGRAEFYNDKVRCTYIWKTGKEGGRIPESLTFEIPGHQGRSQLLFVNFYDGHVLTWALHRNERMFRWRRFPGDSLSDAELAWWRITKILDEVDPGGVNPQRAA
jgi:hypothetical protein